MDEFFLEVLSRNFYACTQTTWGVKQSNKEQTVIWQIFYVRVAAEAHSCVSVEKTFDGSDIEEDKLG